MKNQKINKDNIHFHSSLHDQTEQGKKMHEKIQIFLYFHPSSCIALYYSILHDICLIQTPKPISKATLFKPKMKNRKPDH